MTEVHGPETAASEFRDAAVESPPAEAPGVMVRVLIESKLELGPSEHRSSRPKADEPMPTRRARTRRHS